MTTVGQRVVADIQLALFARLMRADLAYFHANPTGTLISRFTNDANMLRGAATNVLAGLGKEAVTAIFLIALMFYQDWLLALIAFVALPAGAAADRQRSGGGCAASRPTPRPRSASSPPCSTRPSRARATSRPMAWRPTRRARAGRIIESLYPPGRARARTRSVVVAADGDAGRHRRGAGHPLWRPPGDQRRAHARARSSRSSPRCCSPISRSRASPASTSACRKGSRRRSASSPCSISSPRSARRRTPRPLRGRPAARSASRTCASPMRTAPRRCAASSLVVPAGKTVALVGASGAGKSTILNLIPRFYDVAAGAVRIDGVDVRDVTLASLRGAIALVSQEVSLFDDTVRANIAYGRFGASEDEIVAAGARPRPPTISSARLPQGYDTHGRRARRQALGRAAPAHRHRPRHAEERADPAARRGDLGARHGIRAPGAGRAQGADARPHHAGHRAPPLDRDRRRPHLCHRRRPRRRIAAPMPSCCAATAPMRGSTRCNSPTQARLAGRAQGLSGASMLQALAALRRRDARALLLAARSSISASSTRRAAGP